MCKLYQYFNKNNNYNFSQLKLFYINVIYYTTGLKVVSPTDKIKNF